MVALAVLGHPPTGV